MDQKDLFGNKVEDPPTKLVSEHVRGHPEWIYPDGWLEDNEDLTDKEIELFDEGHENRNPFEKCGDCEDHLIEIHRNYPGGYAIEDGMWSDKTEAFICYPCRESDESYPNTIVIYNPEEEEIHKYSVMTHFDEKYQYRYNGNISSDELPELGQNDFEPDDWDFNEKSPIQFRYVSTDGWRGYHEPVVPEGWIELHGDSILRFSEDAQHLKNFDDDIRSLLWRLGVKFAVGFGLSSNVFSSSYTVLAEIPKDELDGLVAMMKMVSQVAALKEEHRDRDRFIRTCITGSSEPTSHAEKMVQAYDMIEEGMTLEEIVKELA